MNTTVFPLNLQLMLAIISNIACHKYFKSHDLGMFQSAMTTNCSFHLLSIQMETELIEIATKTLSHKIVWYDCDVQRSTTQLSKVFLQLFSNGEMFYGN